MEYMLMCLSDLMVIIEMDVYKNALIKRSSVTWFTDKTLEWSLDLG